MKEKLKEKVRITTYLKSNLASNILHTKNLKYTSKRKTVKWIKMTNFLQLKISDIKISWMHTKKLMLL